MNAPYVEPAAAYSRRQSPPGRVWVPKEAGENRLALAAMTDGLLAFIIAFALAVRVFHAHAGIAEFAPVFLPCLFAVSFVNHVVGTLLFRGSLAKLLFGMRVLRWKDGRRPRVLQTLARWLFGYLMIVLQILLEGASVGQACGLRTVRRRDERRNAI
ncbi:RDD family protein [Nocardia tenerifensis]|uniref:RDD family protein n=1 Tax=Nocardia tenerifensis TaxID=228006 RepID=UPI0012F6B45C|nr:RDD family protein [Nocardia tenerifensis]